MRALIVLAFAAVLVPRSAGAEEVIGSDPVVEKPQHGFAPLPSTGTQLGARLGPTVLVPKQTAAYVMPTLGFEGTRWLLPSFGLGASADVGLHREGTERAGVWMLRSYARVFAETRVFFREAYGFRFGAGPGLLWAFSDVRAGGNGEAVHRFAPIVSVRASFETRVTETSFLSIGAMTSAEPRTLECLGFVSYAWLR